MIIRISRVLKEYLKQAIGAFIRVYHFLPDELREFLSRLNGNDDT